MRVIDLGPVNPEHVHYGRLGHGRMQNFDPVDPQNPRMHVRVG